MKTGDKISKSELIQLHFSEFNWFAGYHIFKRYEQKEKVWTYVFLNVWTNIIVTIFTSDV